MKDHYHNVMGGANIINVVVIVLAPSLQLLTQLSGAVGSRCSCPAPSRSTFVTAGTHIDCISMQEGIHPFSHHRFLSDRRPMTDRHSKPDWRPMTDILILTDICPLTDIRPVTEVTCIRLCRAQTVMMMRVRRISPIYPHPTVQNTDIVDKCSAYLPAKLLHEAIWDGEPHWGSIIAGLQLAQDVEVTLGQGRRMWKSESYFL